MVRNKEDPQRCIERLEALHDIERAAINLVGEQVIAETALRHIALWTPHY